MTDARPLHEMIAECVNEYLLENGGGIPNGFVYVVNYIDADGAANYEVGCMEDQSALLSAGMNAYLTAVCQAWVQDALFGEDID